MFSFWDLLNEVTSRILIKSVHMFCICGTLFELYFMPFSIYCHILILEESNVKYFKGFEGLWICEFVKQPWNIVEELHLRGLTSANALEWAKINM